MILVTCLTPDLEQPPLVEETDSERVAELPCLSMISPPTRLPVVIEEGCSADTSPLATGLRSPTYFTYAIRQPDNQPLTTWSEAKPLT